MKFSELMEAEEVVRGRQPHVDYEVVPKKKKEPEGEIDRIIVHLKGKDSEHATKIARKLTRAKRIKAMLAKEEKVLRDQGLEIADKFFDAADDVYSRVISTASLAYLVTKSGPKTADVLDQKGYLAELVELTGLSVNALVKLQEKHTAEKTTQVAPAVRSHVEKKPKIESVSEGIGDAFNKIIASIKSFLPKWDSRFEKLKANIEAEIA